MKAWRWLVTVVVATWTTACAVAKPPATDAERLATMEVLIGAFRPRFEDVPEIDAAELARRLSAGDAPVLVDVRSPAERAVSTLPGAVTPEEVEADPARFAGREIVAYCTIGYRSSAWAQARRKEGLDVKNLHGSLLAWTHAHGPLVVNGAPTRRVHVYGSTWNLAATDHEAVW